jgi:hypothetical protein
MIETAIHKSGIDVLDTKGVGGLQFVSESEATAAYLLAQPNSLMVGYPSLYHFCRNRLTFTGW